MTIPQMFGLSSPTAAWEPPSSPDRWPAAELAATDPRPSWNASPAIDASGHLHLAYETPDGIVYGTDASGSWQSETVGTSTSSTFVSRPSIAVDPTGGVHLVYLSSTTSGTQLLYRRRTSDETWSIPVPVAALAAPASTATIAVDRSGRPVIAYNTWIHISIPLPNTYGQSGLWQGGWWQIRYETPGGGNDTTTWQVSVRGNPVHLVVS